MTIENVQRVEQMVREQRNISVREIMQEVEIGSAAVQTILNEYLHIRKLASRWVPHLLTPEQKQARVDWAEFMLKKFDKGRSKLVSQIITGDETWIYNYDPETKQQSTVWVFEDEDPPTKVVRSRSVGKRMVAVFFRRQGMVKAVPLVQQKTVTAAWYVDVCLPAVFQELNNARPTTGLRGILLHHDNATAHTAARTIDFLHESGVQVVPHPPYSPDLAPCDFFLFPTVKREMKGRRFESEDVAVAALIEVLERITLEEYQSCFERWFRRMNRTIEVRGDYFEKI